MLRQLEILDGRVCQEFKVVKERGISDQLWLDKLTLDLETYYTVAHDLLTLVSRLLPERQRRELRSDRTFKIIATIRNYLVRHAYDKPDGDPSGSFAFNETQGPMLKGGSPYDVFRDPGFYTNRSALASLLEKLPLGELGLPESVAARLKVVAAAKRQPNP